MIVCFCWFNWPEMELKRLLRVWALVSSNWRADTSPGVAEAVCAAAKKALSTEDMPVLESDKVLSMALAWSR